MNRLFFRILVRTTVLVAVAVALAAPLRAQRSSALREQLRTEPGSVVLRVALSDALVAEGFALAALEPLDQALAANPRDLFVLNKSADLLLRLGRYERARKAWNEVLARAPESLDARYGLVKIARALSDWTRTLGLCREILARSPKSYFATLNLAWAHFNRREFAPALRAYSDPVHGQVRTMRLGAAWCRLRLGETGAARQAAEVLLRDFPGDPECAALAAEVVRPATGPAAEPSAPGSRLTTAEAQGLVEKGSSFRSQGKLAQALELARRVLEDDSSNAAAVALAADLTARLGQWSLSSHYGSMLINLSPGAEPLRGKIVALRQLGYWEYAAQLSEDLLEMAKDDPLGLATLAWQRYRTGEFRRALELYRRADPNDALMQQGVAWSLLMLQEYDRAREAFDRILARDPANVSAAEGLRAIGRVRAPRR